MNVKNHVVEPIPTTPPPCIGETGHLKKRPRAFSNNVCIVHERNEAAKTTVARFVDKLGLKPIIFRDKLLNGKQAVDRLQQLEDDVGFAIVLLTADDRAAEKDKLVSDWKPRISENVVFELGYFRAALGRERVCALYQEGVQLPYNPQMLTYLPMGNAEDWQTKLTHQMQAAGLPVNLDKALAN